MSYLFPTAQTNEVSKFAESKNVPLFWFSNPRISSIFHFPWPCSQTPTHVPRIFGFQKCSCSLDLWNVPIFFPKIVKLGNREICGEQSAFRRYRARAERSPADIERKANECLASVSCFQLKTKLVAFPNFLLLGPWFVHSCQQITFSLTFRRYRDWQGTELLLADIKTRVPSLLCTAILGKLVWPISRHNKTSKKNWRER